MNHDSRQLKCGVYLLTRLTVTSGAGLELLLKTACTA
jgi:hypothetical protein